MNLQMYNFLNEFFEKRNGLTKDHNIESQMKIKFNKWTDTISRLRFILNWFFTEMPFIIFFQNFSKILTSILDEAASQPQ